MQASQSRLAGEGLATATEDDVACCYARQDKVWVDGPSGEPWEIYTVLDDIECLVDSFGRSTQRSARNAAPWSKETQSSPARQPVVDRVAK